MGNRFKCLLGALYISDDVRVFWPSNLDIWILDSDSASVDPYIDIVSNSIPEIANREEVKRLIWQEGYATRHCCKWHDTLAMDFNYDPKKFVMQREAFHFLARRYLTPSIKVQKIYASRIDQVRKCQHGIFIRTGDMQVNEFNNNYWKIEDYTVNPDIWTFIVADSPRVYKHFRNWPRVVCFLDEDYIYSGWATHFANMLLLARMPKLTLPRLSTYSEMVYLFNGYTAELELMEQIHDRSKAYGPVSIKEMRELRDKLASDQHGND